GLAPEPAARDRTCVRRTEADLVGNNQAPATTRQSQTRRCSASGGLDSTQHAKAPNSRLQIPKKLPVLSSNRMAGPASWGVGVWDFSGAWCLGFGISLDVHSWFRSLRSGIRAGPGFYNAS